MALHAGRSGDALAGECRLELTSIGDTIEDNVGDLLFSNGAGNEQVPLVIDGGKVFLWLFVGGCVNVIVWSLVNVFVVFLYNLISDLVGGVDVTLAEKR